MRLSALPTCAFAIAASLCASAPAFATSPTTWVAGNGKDTGTCPITAPCKTFQFALGHTNHGGTINVLSAGSFGGVNVGNKSVSIVANGVEAMIESSVKCTASDSTAAVCISGATSVNLRGLTINTKDQTGIEFRSGGELNVEQCVIRNAYIGINFITRSSGHSRLHIFDSLIADSHAAGIEIQPSDLTVVDVILDRVRLVAASGNSARINIFSNSTLTALVRDSVVQGLTVSAVTGNTRVTVERSTFLLYKNGIAVDGGKATVQMRDSVVTRNTVGLSAIQGAIIESFGNNIVRGNGTDGSPTTTVGLK